MNVQLNKVFQIFFLNDQRMIRALLRPIHTTQTNANKLQKTRWPLDLESCEK